MVSLWLGMSKWSFKTWTKYQGYHTFLFDFDNCSLKQDPLFSERSEKNIEILRVSTRLSSVDGS